MKRLLVPLLIILILTNGCSKHSEITTQDKKDMIETAKGYYTDLENRNFSHALNYLYPMSMAIRQFEFTNRSKILNNIHDYYGYRVKLVSMREEVNDNVNTYPGMKSPDKNLYIISAKIQVTYQEKSSIPIDEIVLLKKTTDGQWRIKQIDSCDEYVIVRAFDYYYYGELQW